MDKEQIAEILKNHAAWLRGDKEGTRAYLRGANLTDANLRGANLTDANLRGASLRGANLTDANLRGANLTDANLRGASLKGAYLTGAYLRRADLRRADLTGADLRGAYLTGAYLRRADLRSADLTGASLRDAYLTDAYLTGADLRRADLRSADLTGASLRDAYLTDAKLPDFQIVPEIGAFVGFKKCNTTNGVGCIVTIEIPPEAKRTSSLIGRKCRAEFVKVLAIDGAELGVSIYDNKTEYRVGEIVRADKFDDDIRVECSNGIHFFLTRKEAERYD